MRVRDAFTHQNNTFPDRGSRVARWVRSFLVDTGMTQGEFAFKIQADKRDVQRLLADESCGHRLEDKIASAFKWDFVEAVMSPVCGGDLITIMEGQLAERIAEAEAIHAQIERARHVRSHLLEPDRAGPRRRRAGDFPNSQAPRGGRKVGASTHAGARPGGDIVFDF